MLYSLRGELAHTELMDAYYLAVVECAGVGYGVKTTYQSVAALPKLGNEVFLYTYLYVREDTVELYGFADMEELNCFKMLISVSGVGPKVALSILSDISAQKFALCVATGDSKTLTKSKGVGAKTAQRIVLELKDKITKEQVASGAVGAPVEVNLDAGNAAEAISALTVLGYSQSEAAQAVSKIDPSASVEEMIKQGLKALAGRI